MTSDTQDKGKLRSNVFSISKAPVKAKWFGRYFFIDSTGEVGQATWKESEGDYFRLQSGNVFETEAEAIKKLRFIQLEHTIFKRIEELNNGWTPDWKNTTQKKCFLYIKPINNEICWMFYPCTRFLGDKWFLKHPVLAEQLITELKSSLIEFFNNL